MKIHHHRARLSGCALNDHNHHLDRHHQHHQHHHHDQRHQQQRVYLEPCHPLPRWEDSTVVAGISEFLPQLPSVVVSTSIEGQFGLKIYEQKQPAWQKLQDRQRILLPPHSVFLSTIVPCWPCRKTLPTLRTIVSRTNHSIR